MDRRWARLLERTATGGIRRWERADGAARRVGWSGPAETFARVQAEVRSIAALEEYGLCRSGSLRDG
jgi:hypothetical protein